MSEISSRIAIVDYGMGNLFNVKRACEYFGMHAAITSSYKEIESADAVILPGVGAFGDAMKNLEELNLVGLLQDTAAQNKPLVGICLGVQLLMEESLEFGTHKGLGIFKGRVVKFDHPMEGGRELKVPQVGWNRINKAKNPSRKDAWQGTLLEGIKDGVFMYFVHSYVVQPNDPEIIISTTKYGHIDFCSCLGRKNIFACQFHPERSDIDGLKVYRNLASLIQHIQKEDYLDRKV
ncbi:MAG: imidazole glycerol phosphate synthase subunit HisH [Methanothrix sp.]